MTFATGLLGLALSACDPTSNANSENNAQPQPAESVGTPYQLSLEAVTQWKLPAKLREISGLTMTDDGRLLAHDDERGEIFELDFTNGSIIKRFYIGSETIRDDFEGIARYDDTIVLSTSAGVLYLTREGADKQSMPYDRIDTGLGDSCEFEGLAFNPMDRVLLLPCKSIRAKPDDTGLLVYAWSVDEGERRQDLDIRVSKSRLNELTGKKKFAASGIAIDPVTEHRILISAQQTVLLELDAAGTALTGHHLPDGSRHEQSEGIAFHGSQQLLIADEGGKGRARLAIYEVRP